MHSHKDKKLYIIIAVVMGVFFAGNFILLTAAHGLKTGVAALWVMFALVVFFSIVGLTMKKSYLKTDNVVLQGILGLLSEYFYRTFLMSLFILLSIASVYVFAYIDKTIPEHKAEPPVSSVIPQHPALGERLQYVLSNENIVSWKEIDHGFSIQLTDKAQQEVFNLTRENVGKRFDFYVSDLLVATPVINEPINSNSMMLAVDEKIKDEVHALLTAMKSEGQ